MNNLKTLIQSHFSNYLEFARALWPDDPAETEKDIQNLNNRVSKMVNGKRTKYSVEELTNMMRLFKCNYHDMFPEDKLKPIEDEKWHISNMPRIIISNKQTTNEKMNDGWIVCENVDPAKMGIIVNALKMRDVLQMVADLTEKRGEYHRRQINLLVNETLNEVNQ